MSEPIKSELEYFFALSPEKVLQSVEAAGLRCTGRCLALNSMENRVYEVEIEVDNPKLLRTPSEHFRIAKFYRPKRWSREQILEEHEFLLDLVADEIPAVAPLSFAPGGTLQKVADTNIYYALFPKQGGRSPQELNDEECVRLGRLLARMHNVGGAKKAKHRLLLNPTTYGRNNLDYLRSQNLLPPEIASRYQKVVEQICDKAEPWFAGLSMQRIHGDCHFGNILWATAGPFLVDFDDMVVGPCVQDLWLVMPGRDEEARRQLDVLLSGYNDMRPFDRGTLRLIEVLRALRFVHFSSWIARRWSDPAFPRSFPNFADKDYWHKQLYDLEEQWSLIAPL